MQISYSLCQGRKIILSNINIAEAMVEVCYLKDNPCMIRQGYEVVAFEGDEVLGLAGFDDSGEFAVVGPASVFAEA